MESWGSSLSQPHAGACLWHPSRQGQSVLRGVSQGQSGALPPQAGLGSTLQCFVSLLFPPPAIGRVFN